MHINELLSLHRIAVQASAETVKQVHSEDLDRPTPCAQWTVADLLAHMTAQHHGFAAAACGRGGDLAAWRVNAPGPNPASEYADAAEDVLAAFNEPGVSEREFELPEFKPVSRFPATLAIGFHLIDYVVHDWDMARALGLDYKLAPELADVALRIALAVPNGDNRLAPDTAFQPALTSTDTDPLRRILATLGRSPDWSRP
ncbi:TIGR03086 family metal-binding protein [Kutzneria sp. NPDC052558]|uniref:TIGR03086 family metal-binding protein n=1 Tax=Kutzneria sp. NPDC052558 TaxID=3364121 RepID=UPI0037C863D7